MQHNNFNMQLILVNIRHDIIDTQNNNVNMRDNYDTMQLRQQNYVCRWTYISRMFTLIYVACCQKLSCIKGKEVCNHKNDILNKKPLK